MNHNFQYAYGRSPLYCNIDQSITDITTCGFWLDMDGEISAPNFLPVGCSHSRDITGSRVFKNFVKRGWTLEEDQENAIVANLIDEILAENP